MAIEYFLNKKSEICVVSLSGKLDASDAAVLEQCMVSLSEAGKFRYIVVSMAGIQGCGQDAGRHFTKFQRAIREKGNLLICQLQAGVERDLKARGLLRDDEVERDLISALTKIVSREKR